jgi:hypothetical protein
MAERKSKFFAVRTEGGAVEGVYIARTGAQALAEHTKPLVATELDAAQVAELLGEGGFRAVAVEKG